MFTLQIQVADTDDLVMVAAICELLLQNAEEYEFPGELLQNSLEWVHAKFETYLEMNRHADAKKYVGLAYQFERLVRLIHEDADKNGN